MKTILTAVLLIITFNSFASGMTESRESKQNRQQQGICDDMKSCN